MKLTICALTFNSEIFVEPFIKSLSNVKYDDLLIVGNASTDRTVELAESNGARVISTPCSRGKGRDLCAENAEGDIVMLCDIDNAYDIADFDWNGYDYNEINIFKDSLALTVWFLLGKKSILKEAHFGDINEHEDSAFFVKYKPKFHFGHYGSDMKRRGLNSYLIGESRPFYRAPAHYKVYGMPNKTLLETMRKMGVKYWLAGIAYLFGRKLKYSVVKDKKQKIYRMDP